jgi:P27 family predicted phage terminase small subunit
MKPGPKKKPTHLRLLEGNPSKRPISASEPVCNLPPVKPRVVETSPVASAEWDRVLAAMPPNLYSALDVSLLSIYALSWCMLDKAQHALITDGVVVQTPKGRMSHPALRAWRNASDTLTRCADRLGLHPGARASLQIPERGTELSKFSGLLGRTTN